MCAYSLAGNNILISTVYHSLKGQEDILETLVSVSGSTYIQPLDVMSHARDNCCSAHIPLRAVAAVRTISWCPKANTNTRDLWPASSERPMTLPLDLLTAQIRDHTGTTTCISTLAQFRKLLYRNPSTGKAKWQESLLVPSQNLLHRYYRLAHPLFKEQH